jgi:NAD(P)H-hydrate epimerase
VTYLPLPDSGNGFPGKDSAQVLREMLDGYDVLLVGCGLGRSKETAEQVESLVLSGGTPEIPIVIDADGLNILAEVIHREKSWRRLPADAILTPHPGEMARLTGMSVESIQSDRLGVAARMARDWHKTVVLKGAYTVVAAPGGRVMVSPFANPGLASAGTGDVLAGIIAGLVAQGLPLFEASVAGVFLHGKAGEMVCRRIGDTGMIAGDLLPVLPEVIKQLRENHIEIDGR